MTALSYPPWVPSKFSPSGEVQNFPGNTILCHIPPQSPLLQALRSLYARIGAHPFASRVTLLPPSSWHMTVIEGVCDQIREPGRWPANHLSSSLEQYTDECAPRVRLVGGELENLGLSAPYHMKAVGLVVSETGISLDLQGATEEEDKRVRRLRDYLADALGFRHPGHETYKFHTGLAYFVQVLESCKRDSLKLELEQELARCPLSFDLGSAEFCLFEDMFRFDRQFYIE